MKSRKVVIIGAGHVGSHVGYSLAVTGLVTEIVYIDTDEAKAIAQALDISDAVNYFGNRVRVSAGGYKELNDADLMVVSAGPLPDPKSGQTRMDTLKQTVDVIKDIIANVKKTSFSGVIVNISNPADVVTHYIQTGLQYPARKILSTSTTLDSARLRRSLSEKLNIDPRSIQAYVMGEHGESQMVAWTAATIAGQPLLNFMAKRGIGKDQLGDIANKAREGGWTVLRGKGSTEFGIGTSLTEVARAIFGNEHKVLPVSVLLNGEYGQHDVYASVPAVVGADGIVEIIDIPLSDEEQKAFANSCKVMKDNYELALSWK